MLERKTVISEHVINQLLTSKKPISIETIMNTLNEKKLFPHKTTVTRILDKLVSRDYANRIQINQGITFYEIKSTKDHHHFFCTNCNEIYCLSSCIIDQKKINLENYVPNKNFKIKSHDLNLYGLCGKCAR